MKELDQKLESKDQDPLKRRQGEFGNTPILEAIVRKDRESALAYIEKADLDALNMADTQPQCRNTALFLAIKQGWEKGALALIEKGVEVNVEAADGFTPLHYACLTRQDKVITALLAKGAKLHAINRFKATPADYYLYQYSELDQAPQLKVIGKQIAYLSHRSACLPDFMHATYYPITFENIISKTPDVKIIEDLKQNSLSQGFKKHLIAWRTKKLTHILEMIRIGALLHYSPYICNLQIRLDEIFSKKYGELLEVYGASYPNEDLKNEAYEAAVKSLIIAEVEAIKTIDAPAALTLKGNSDPRFDFSSYKSVPITDSSEERNKPVV